MSLPPVKEAKGGSRNDTRPYNGLQRKTSVHAGLLPFFVTHMEQKRVQGSPTPHLDLQGPTNQFVTHSQLSFDYKAIQTFINLHNKRKQTEKKIIIQLMKHNSKEGDIMKTHSK